MTEEAREAAARSAWSKYAFTYPPNGSLVNAEVRAFDAGFDAGVAEGIRQAREALATTDPTWPRGMYGSPDDMYSKIAIQRAFEWLETTD